MHSNKERGAILKSDYEKAYDRVCWDFLFEVLQSRGFDQTWIGWIEKIVKKGSVGVCLNGDKSSFFKTEKGLRQGDPLSPLLFNLVSDVLTKMLLKGANLGLVKGLASGFREEGIIALQYADDTIVFTDVEENHLVNLKGILLWFEQISGMRVNFHKSEIIPMNLSVSEAHDLSHFFLSFRRVSY
jgi:hypothetical protein